MGVKYLIILLSIVFLINISGISGQSQPCVLREYPDGFVCVCNSTYCDTLDTNDALPKGPAEFILVSSTKGGLRFSLNKGQIERFRNERILKSDSKWEPKRRDFPVNSDNDPDLITLKEVKINVDRNDKYQKILGFGGAFTGAVSYNLDQLSESLVDHIYRSYYSKDVGIGYNLLRTPIGGCDFDLEPWAYNETPENDKKLSNFTHLDERDERKINKIKDLMKITNNYDIKLFGAAWSPPVWMKTNGEWTGFSRLKTEYYETWAQYHIKFLELMASKNISIWAISTGNEPINGFLGAWFVHFMSLGWTAVSQGKWVGENLGPMLKNSQFKNVKLFGGDDQRYTLSWWIQRMDKGNENSTSYLDGIAVHWYWDRMVPANLLDLTHNIYKDKLIVNTESCLGDKPLDVHGPVLGSWKRATRYAQAYIQDFQHWVNGWIDWNIVLDEKGGPNYVDNTVESPVIVNVTSGEEIYKQPIFYAIGHFSKFIPENSVRIYSKSSSRNLEVVAFERPDGNVVIVIYNSSSKEVKLTIADTIRGGFVLNIPKESINTLLYQ